MTCYYFTYSKKTLIYDFTSSQSHFIEDVHLGQCFISPPSSPYLQRDQTRNIKPCKTILYTNGAAHLAEPPAETGSLDHIVFAALPVPPVCSVHKLSPRPASARPELGTRLAPPAASSLEIKIYPDTCFTLFILLWRYLHQGVITSGENYVVSIIFVDTSIYQDIATITHRQTAILRNIQYRIYNAAAIQNRGEDTA